MDYFILLLLKALPPESWLNYGVYLWDIPWDSWDVLSRYMEFCNHLSGYFILLLLLNFQLFPFSLITIFSCSLSLKLYQTLFKTEGGKKTWTLNWIQKFGSLAVRRRNNYESTHFPSHILFPLIYSQWKTKNRTINQPTQLTLFTKIHRSTYRSAA